MRARVARLFRTIADRIAGQTERDTDLARMRLLEVDNGHLRRRAEQADAAAERAYTERDRAWAEARLWLGTVDDCNTVIARQGAALARRPSAEVARPVFGRRLAPPSHLRPVE